MSRLALDRGYETGAVHRGLELLGITGYIPAIQFSNPPEKYGFSYDGSSESFKELKEKLKEGDTAIVYLPGHYGTIVDYNAKKDKYLLMDPHYLPKRGTSSFGDWVSQKDLEGGALMVQTFFYYKAE